MLRRFILKMKCLLIVLALLLSFAYASLAFDHRPYDVVWNKRETPSPDSLTVDLGYERYRGVPNVTSRLNVFKG